jgi:hypothetical protein
VWLHMFDREKGDEGWHHHHGGVGQKEGELRSQHDRTRGEETMGANADDVGDQAAVAGLSGSSGSGS